MKGFDGEGVAILAALVDALSQRSGGRPVYVPAPPWAPSCAGAGARSWCRQGNGRHDHHGRACRSRLCEDAGLQARLPLYLTHGSRDSVYPARRSRRPISGCGRRLSGAVRFVFLGSHGTPVRMSDWREASTSSLRPVEGHDASNSPLSAETFLTQLEIGGLKPRLLPVRQPGRATVPLPAGVRRERKSIRALPTVLIDERGRPTARPPHRVETGDLHSWTHAPKRGTSALRGSRRNAHCCRYAVGGDGDHPASQSADDFCMVGWALKGQGAAEERGRPPLRPGGRRLAIPRCRARAAAARAGQRTPRRSRDRSRGKRGSGYRRTYRLFTRSCTPPKHSTSPTAASARRSSRAMARPGSTTWATAATDVPVFDAARRAIVVARMPPPRPGAATTTPNASTPAGRTRWRR